MIRKFLQISGFIVLQVLRNTNEEAGNFFFLEQCVIMTLFLGMLYTCPALVQKY